MILLKPARHFFSFLIYSNLFIAFCAVLMTGQTYRLLFQFSPNLYFTGFVFFATLCSYSFHWYLTTETAIASLRVEWTKKYRFIHQLLFIAGLTGAVIFFFHFLQYWPWFLAAVIAAFLYSAPKIPHPYFRSLRKIAIGKTIFLSLVWMYVTTVLPLVVSGQPFSEGAIFFILHRFFLIYAICILFDLRDRVDDLKNGIKSLITYLSAPAVRTLFYSSLLLSAAAVLLMTRGGYTTGNLILLIAPCIILAFLYNYASKNFNDYFYYFILDGLMAFSAFLLLIAGK